MEIRNRNRDARPFRTKDGSTIREYLRTQRQSLAEASLPPGGSTQRHYHGRSEEIYLLLEGDATMELDGEEQVVGPGDAVLIPHGSPHRITAGPGGTRFLCCCAPHYSDEDTFFA